MKSINGLSIIVITLNEEDDIGECLESVKDIAAEIVVADSGSTDKTLEICAKFTNKIFHCDWHGYGNQKQFALDNASGPWIMNIDADERVSSRLAQEIRQALSNPASNDISGFSIPYRNFFFGRHLRFAAGWNERHIRLFRKEKSRYGMDLVHEGIKVDPPLGRLSGPIDHVSYKNLSEYLSKCNLYTTLIAEKKFKTGGRFHFWHFFRLPMEFIYRYIFKLGFLDGAAGLIYTILSSYYVWLKFIKLWEMEKLFLKKHSAESGSVKKTGVLE